MPVTSKQPTPAELSGLEHAFAADPGSDAYRPLTEAYLAMGRFMEAMVVCKKGVKAHPDDPAAKVLLAKVYAEQGKDRKALEELQAVLAAYPTFAAANRMAGVLHIRLGEREPGEAALRRAAEAAPDDPEVREALQKHGVAVVRKPAAGGPPVAPRVAPRVPGAPPAPSAAQDPTGITGEIRIDEEAPAPTPVPAKRTRNVEYAEELAAKYATREFTLSTPAGKRARPSKKGTIATTAGLFAVLVAALGGFWLLNKSRAETVREIDRLLKEALPLIDKDVPAAYAEAAARCRTILERDEKSIAGHAFLAYVDAILAGEHGGGDEAKSEAVRHVEAARKLGQRHSHLVAAEAYLRLYGGDAAGAKETLKAVVEGEEGVQSPFLFGVLGAVHLREGDLDAARDVLAKAQKASPGDVRVAWLLAEQYRRRGEGYELQAAGFYDYALRIQKEHLSSILGKAIVLLDRGQVDEAGKAAELVLSPQSGASRPQQALAYAIRGGVLAAQGKAQDAKAAEEQASRLDPTNADIPHRVAVRKLREGDAAGAVEAMQRAVTLDPRRVSLYADLVRALLGKEGGAKQAIDTVKKAQARLGEHPRLALVLGDAYRAAGDADLARGQYEKAIQLGRPFPDARVALARLHRAKNNIPGALVELTQAIDEYGQGGAGGAAAAYVEMAEAERARGATPAALKGLYVKALEKDPASCDALWGAAKIEIDQGSIGDDGRKRLDAYARLCPRGPHAVEAAKLSGR
ncbi:MAG TPA: tetratricopeptide repeat protein [Anaeromyxobacter sp.]